MTRGERPRDRQRVGGRVALALADNDADVEALGSEHRFVGVVDELADGATVSLDLACRGRQAGCVVDDQIAVGTLKQERAYVDRGVERERRGRRRVQALDWRLEPDLVRSSSIPLCWSRCGWRIGCCRSSGHGLVREVVAGVEVGDEPWVHGLPAQLLAGERA